jgi:MFS transporter, DHA3 family, macrolide efflux protein
MSGGVADPVTALPEEDLEATVPPTGAVQLLRRRDFRRTYAAIVVSELGDSFQYIALMWFALVTAGPLGVLAVRLADSVPALLFGLHGGLVADRSDRRRVMISSDLVRGIVLLPVAAAGLAGRLDLWMLIVAAFVLETATSYFQPACGALLPTLVNRENVQPANGLVRATAEAVRVGGWAGAAGLLVFVPLSTFFLLNAASFFASALLLTGVRARAEALGSEAPRIREGFAALRPHPTLAIGVLALGAGVTISSGAWIVGVPQLVHRTLHLGAGSFSAIATGYGVGAVAAGLLLSRVRIQAKAHASLLLWLPYAVTYGLFAVAGSLPLAVVAGGISGGLQAGALILLYSAAQEEIPDALLGRVVGLVSLVHRGAHATGLILIGPLFAIAATRTVFWGAAISLPLVGLLALGAAAAARGRGRR